MTHWESKPKRIAQRHLLVISVSLATHTRLVCFVPNSLEKVLAPPIATPAYGFGPFPWDLKPQSLRLETQSDCVKLKVTTGLLKKYLELLRLPRMSRIWASLIYLSS